MHYAVLRSYLCLRLSLCTSATDSSNVVIRESGPAVTLSLDGSAVGEVAHVVNLGADIQMARVNAPRIRAQVTHE